MTLPLEPLNQIEEQALSCNDHLFAVPNFYVPWRHLAAERRVHGSRKVSSIAV